MEINIFQIHLKSKKKSWYTVLQKLVIFSSLFCLSCLVALFQGQVKDPKLALEKKEHLLLAVTKLMTKACPGAISLVLFFAQKIYLGNRKSRT